MHRALIHIHPAPFVSNMKIHIRAALIQIICRNIHIRAGWNEAVTVKNRAGDPLPLRSARTSSTQSPFSPASLSASVSCHRLRRHERFTPPPFTGLADQALHPPQHGGRIETGEKLGAERVERLSTVPLGGASARVSA